MVVSLIVGGTVLSFGVAIGKMIWGGSDQGKEASDLYDRIVAVLPNLAGRTAGVVVDEFFTELLGGLGRAIVHAPVALYTEASNALFVVLDQNADGTVIKTSALKDLLFVQKFMKEDPKCQDVQGVVCPPVSEARFIVLTPAGQGAASSSAPSMPQGSPLDCVPITPVECKRIPVPDLLLGKAWGNVKELASGAWEKVNPENAGKVLMVAGGVVVVACTVLALQEAYSRYKITKAKTDASKAGILAPARVQPSVEVVADRPIVGLTPASIAGRPDEEKRDLTTPSTSAGTVADRAVA